MPTTTIIIPAYNEEHRLPVAEFLAFAKKNPDIVFLFVNDGSTDGTAKMLTIFLGKSPNIQVLNLTHNCGKAESVRCGVVTALHQQSTFIGFWDADLATPLAAIRPFIEYLTKQQSVDMIFGARVQLLGHIIVRKPWRHYMGRIFATLASIMLRLPIYDTQCGAKLFRSTSQLKEVFAKPFHTKWIFDVEIIARFGEAYGVSCQELYDKISEYPLNEWHDIHGSKMRMIHFLTAPWELWTINRKYPHIRQNTDKACCTRVRSNKPR
jgi:glycosyltransferase involved in cell wall biosynthesis